MGLSLLLERERELERLRVVTAAAAAGRGGAVLVEGPPGIGKSALLDAASALADGAGAEVLTARGADLEEGLRFGVARQLLEERAERVPARGRAAPARRMLARAEADDDPHLVAHSLFWLTAELARATPLALVIDDVQWADVESLRWLLYLAGRVGGIPVALLLAARPAATELGRRLAAAPELLVLRPAPLGVAAAAELLAAELGEPVAAEFAACCAHVTGGVPLYVRELAAAARERGLAPGTPASAAALEALGPERLRREVPLRAARAGTNAAAVADAVAVLGPEASLVHVATLAEVTGGEAGAAADALAAASILRPGRPLAFAHRVLRSAVYDELAPARRSALHRRAAGLLAADGAEPGRVAAHLLQCEPAGDPSVVQTLRQAAAGAAPATAARLLRRALEEPPAAGERPALLEQLGSAEEAAFDGRAAEHLAAALRVARSADARGRIAIRLAAALWFAGEPEPARTALHGALRELDPAEAEPARSLVLELWAEALMLGLSGDAPGRRLDAASRARLWRLAEPAGSAAERGLLAALAYTEPFFGGRASAALDGSRRVLAAEPPPRGGRLYPYFDALWALRFAGAWDEARRHAGAAAAAAEESGNAEALAIALTDLAGLAAARGELAAARADAEAALELTSELCFTWLRPECAAILAEVCVAQADPGAAAAALAAGQAPDRDRLGQRPSVAKRAHLLVAAARLALVDGRSAEARRDAFAAGALLAERHEDHPAYVRWRAAAALAAHRTGDRAAALALADADVAAAESFGAAPTIGAARALRALLAGNADELEAAVALLSGTPARLAHVEALIALGGVLRRAGARGRAREHLLAGLEAARACGAAALAEQAAEDLRALGIRPPARRASGHLALTPAERRVADRAAAGLSNGEIAASLFLSRKTVEMHLSRAYRKLGISARGELAARLGAG